MKSLHTPFKMDFTIKEYVKLLKSLQKQGFLLHPFSEFSNDDVRKVIILRQDVDLLPGNSLQFAKLQSDLGIRSTFYFRSVLESFDKKIIKAIADLGHEIGYHYEDLVLANQEAKRLRKNEKELAHKAIKSFSENLARLREIESVTTVCMHGSPMSKLDSRLLWKYYDYRDFGVTGEPYFDIAFDEVLYLTDTGRRWDGSAVSVRDKAKSIGERAGGTSQKVMDNTYNDWVVRPVKGSLMNMTRKSKDFQKTYSFHSTNDIIRALEEDRFPDRAMITFHPQRWTDKPFPWIKELVIQNTKNMVKFFLVNRRL